MDKVYSMLCSSTRSPSRAITDVSNQTPSVACVDSAWDGAFGLQIRARAEPANTRVLRLPCRLIRGYPNFGILYRYNERYFLAWLGAAVRPI